MLEPRLKAITSLMPSLIFLPGASGKTAFWMPLIKLLPDTLQTKIVAYPGFDHAPAQAEVHDFASLTRYVMGQIQQPCILVAQSMGGIFAVEAALSQPELVKGLILMATSGGINLQPFAVEDWRLAYQNSFLHYPDWFVTAQCDYTSRLSEIKCPVLLLWGDHDPISPVAVGEYLQQQFLNARLAIIPGGDHLFAETRAVEVAPHVYDYLYDFAVGEV